MATEDRRVYGPFAGKPDYSAKRYAYPRLNSLRAQTVRTCWQDENGKWYVAFTTTTD